MLQVLGKCQQLDLAIKQICNLSWGYGAEMHPALVLRGAILVLLKDETDEDKRAYLMDYIYNLEA